MGNAKEGMKAKWSVNRIKYEKETTMRKIKEFRSKVKEGLVWGWCGDDVGDKQGWCEGKLEMNTYKDRNRS